ncbi:MAG: response regulator [Chloroflexia bacterium]|nr:response regulator [Chloroflexia bacterium]
MSEATVRRRVKNLLSQKIIDVVACVDPSRVGLEVEALVFLQTDLDKLTQIGQQLCVMEEVRQLIYTSGRQDLVVWLALPSSDQLLPFLTQRIASIPGIKSTQISSILRVGKRPQDWCLPDVDLPRAPASPGPLILLVDDDADFCAAAKMVLQVEGYRVRACCDGRGALACLQDCSPQLILLDLIIETPLAGLELAQSLKESERLQGVPILAVSAIRSTEWGNKLPPPEQMPFDGFVDKPIEPGVLLEQVDRLIGGGRAH